MTDLKISQQNFFSDLKNVENEAKNAKFLTKNAENAAQRAKIDVKNAENAAETAKIEVGLYKNRVSYLKNDLDKLMHPFASKTSVRDINGRLDS